jgi:hypothetical protein
MSLTFTWSSLSPASISARYNSGKCNCCQGIGHVTTSHQMSLPVEILHFNVKYHVALHALEANGNLFSIYQNSECDPDIFVSLVIASAQRVFPLFLSRAYAAATE